MKYGEGYYEGSESNYGMLGGYNGPAMRFLRFWVYRKAMSILKKHKGGGSLLDLGCAYGFWAGLTSKNGFDAKGCDISCFAVSMAKKRFPGMDFYEKDIETGLDFGDGEFDVVTAFDVLEHCRKLDGVLSEIRRVLKKEGILLVVVPDTDFFSEEKDKDDSHVWYMNLKGWEKAFKKNGFRMMDSWVFPRLMKKLRPGLTVRFILLGKD